MKKSGNAKIDAISLAKCVNMLFLVTSLNARIRYRGVTSVGDYDARGNKLCSQFIP